MRYLGKYSKYEWSACLFSIWTSAWERATRISILTCLQTFVFRYRLCALWHPASRWRGADSHAHSSIVVDSNRRRKRRQSIQHAVQTSAQSKSLLAQADSQRREKIEMKNLLSQAHAQSGNAHNLLVQIWSSAIIFQAAVKKAESVCLTLHDRLPWTLYGPASSVQTR